MYSDVVFATEKRSECYAFSATALRKTASQHRLLEQVHSYFEASLLASIRLNAELKGFELPCNSNRMHIDQDRVRYLESYQGQYRRSLASNQDS